MAKSKPSVQHEYTFRNQFLIAMPNMDDPNFCQTVTYITEHNARGALGIVINRPLDFTLTQLLKHLEIASNLPNIDRIQVCQGGPVQPDQGFVLHSPAGNWSTTLPISEDLGITTSRDILQAIAHGQGPQRLFIALGYAGWGPGQLEQEIAQNAWLSTPFDADILFSTPIAERWQAAATLLGIDLRLLSSDVGHA